MSIIFAVGIFSCNGPKNASAPEILEEFRKDEAAAVEKYLDKRLVVYVPIQLMVKNIDGGVTIIYTDYKTDYSVQFNIAPSQLGSAKNLTTNTIAQLSGICADGGKNRDIVFKDCKVVE